MQPVIPPHPLSPHDGWMASFPHWSFPELGAYDINIPVIEEP
jgi:hypothetical protein